VITLALDASTYRGTVAVFRDRELVAASEAAMRGAQADALMPAIVATLEQAGVSVSGLDRVICGAGPGSFTSLRIAGGIAKGICVGRDIPLFAVSSLGLTLAAASAEPGRYVVTIDALRDEWYAATFTRDASGAITQETAVSIVGRDAIQAFAASAGGTIVGAANGDAAPHASGTAALFDEIDRRGPADLARWEPSYGRLAEAQVRWEAAHGRSLGA
jgi:tRNA threonylcarbamoyladenosine biosynthesis protein TsaB